jgi:hypothetical protein
MQHGYRSASERSGPRFLEICQPSGKVGLGGLTWDALTPGFATNMPQSTMPWNDPHAPPHVARRGLADEPKRATLHTCRW